MNHTAPSTAATFRKVREIKLLHHCSLQDCSRRYATYVFRFALDSEPRGSKIKYFFFILDGTQAE